MERPWEDEVVARGTSSGAGVGSVLVVAVALLLLAALPVQAEEHGANGTAEVTEVEASVGASPSGAAGLSLLGAAVLATLWSVAGAERRARTATTD